MLYGMPMTPAPTIVLMKLKEALDTELSPPLSSWLAESAPAALSDDKFKGDSSSWADELGIAVNSCCCASPCWSRDAM